MLKEQYIDKTRVALFGKVSHASSARASRPWRLELCLTTVSFLLSH